MTENNKLYINTKQTGEKYAINDTAQNELRSKDVREILSKKTGFLERWSLFMYLCILIIFFCISWFIKSPDIVEANAILTSANPSVKIVSRANGKIEKLFVFDGDTVKKDDIIALLQIPGSSSQVLELIKLTDSSTSLLRSGEIQKAKAILKTNFKNIELLQNFYNQFLTCLGTAKKDNLLQTVQTLVNLKTAWLEKYVIRAVSNGKVMFTLPLHEGVLLQQGSLLGFVIFQQSNYYVRVHFPQSGLTKVCVGQKVQLHFEAYPFDEFGYVEGKISNISKVLSDSGFLAIVQLSNGLNTSNNKQIAYINGLKARALIITKNLRLLQRFCKTITQSSRLSLKIRYF